ncbi:fumarylacetoacetate hydrolase family protein [Paracoccus sp. Z118]|uniref:fumarylacetoacetate hydrolase family protein n=1 Tax=Paracoccus sp. Z118 TaxID=2851017 RepID=UPI001C2CBFCF|nr:fumarylacetoacetate hydrolase family protein [Paracoccus sp. Z118]MBV0891369.1 fumarylacetoacetate hydrolase family protein [Paracoccus sp. Z118]
MTKRLFESPEFPAVPVVGEDSAYPVHRIFCVGRNYADHAKEMGVEVDREAPFYFLKHAQALVQSGATVPYPPGTQNLHHEMEFVVVIGAPLFKAGKDAVMDAVFGYATGLDMTRRDLQLKAREKGRPWDFGKDFEQSAVLSPITRAEGFGKIDGQRIWMELDGSIRQDAKLSDLIWSVPEILSDLSHYYHLHPGDVIYTGTPAGVGPVEPGGRLRGGVDGLAEVELTLGPAE